MMKMELPSEEIGLFWWEEGNGIVLLAYKL